MKHHIKATQDCAESEDASLRGNSELSQAHQYPIADTYHMMLCISMSYLPQHSPQGSKPRALHVQGGKRVRR